MTTPLSPVERRRIGRRVLAFATLDSTNTHALSLANDPDNHGVAIVAGAQTAGRGQHGRTWTATPDSSVLMSVLIFPPRELRRPALLTAWAAVAACDVIGQVTGKQPRIKWPNDVLVDGRKVCGILIEQRSLGPHVATVAGIGLNVTQHASDFAAAGLPDAGSLAMFVDEAPETPIVTQMLLGCLDANYERLEAGETSDLERRWQECLGVIGESVVVEGTRSTCLGKIQHLGFDGVQLLMPDCESLLHIPPEEIRHIHVDRNF